MWARECLLFGSRDCRLALQRGQIAEDKAAAAFAEHHRETDLYLAHRGNLSNVNYRSSELRRRCGSPPACCMI